MKCVSIILISYNQPQYIYQAIDSIVVQKYQNIQLIIADDGSDSFDGEKIEDYIEQRKPKNIVDFIVFHNEQNLGTVKNLNKALEVASGDYVLICAGDDSLFDENVIDRYVECFRNLDDNTVIVAQVVNYDKELKDKIGSVLTSEHIKLLQSSANPEIYATLCEHCFIPATGCMYPRGLIMRNGGFDEGCVLVEDWMFFLKLARKGVHFEYAEFVASKHRDGGVSQKVKKKREESNDQYHRDLLYIIQNEILKNYSYVPANKRKGVYNAAHDRIVISEYRKNFSRMSLKEKLEWIMNNKNLPAVIFRGCVRKIRRRREIIH